MPLPLRLLLSSSRVLSAAGTCKLSSTTSSPPPSRTDTPGSLDSYWSRGSSERWSIKDMTHHISWFIPSNNAVCQGLSASGGSHLKPVRSLLPGIAFSCQRINCHPGFPASVRLTADNWDDRQVFGFLHTTAVTTLRSHSAVHSMADRILAHSHTCIYIRAATIINELISNRYWIQCQLFW